MLSRLLVVAILLSGSLAAQINLSRQTVYTITTVAGLPVTGRSGQPYLVQDSADGTCLVGGGAQKVKCVWDGAWSVYGGGAGGGAVASVNGLTGAVTLGAADVGSTPTGGTAAANVQAAIAELTAEKLATNGDGSGLDNVVTEAGTHTVSGFKAVTGTYDFGNGILEIPNGTTLPATCAVGHAFMDTDAPTGQRHYLCQASNVWALQGAGGSASLSGTPNFLAYFDSANSAISSNIGVTPDTLIFPVSVGRAAWGDGDTYIHETTNNNLRIAVGGTDRVGFSTGTISGLALGRFSLRYASNSCAQPTFSFTQDDDNGLCYEGTNNFGLSVGGTKRIDFTAALQTFSTPVRFDSYLDFPETAAPANPAADFGRFFVKDDAGDTKGCFVDSAGVEVCIGDGGGAGDGIGSDSASDVPFVPYDTLAATNVQAAIQELLDEGGGSLALGDLTDVEPTGAVEGDVLTRVGAEWVPAPVLTPTNVVNVEGKTFIGGLPRTGTNTLPPGSNEIINCSHQDNVPSLVGVPWGTLCVQEDTRVIYQAQPNEGVAGVTDNSADWVSIGGGSSPTQYAFFATASREGGGSSPGPGFNTTATGACLVNAGSGSGFDYGFMSCDSAADENFSFLWRIPANWDGTNLDLHVLHNWNSGGTVGTAIYLDVAFACRATDGSENEPTFPAANTLIFTAPASPNTQISAGEITAPTLTGCGAGDFLNINFTRDADNVSDDYAVDARFVGIELEWGTN